MSFVERRHATRFGLRLPVIVRWKDGSELREACSMSEDVSTKGVYFVLTEGIKVGTAVDVEMNFPSQIGFEARLRVCCSGRIQRSELEGDKAGVAAIIEKYRLRSERIPAEKLSSGRVTKP